MSETQPPLEPGRPRSRIAYADAHLDRDRLQRAHEAMLFSRTGDAERAMRILEISPSAQELVDMSGRATEAFWELYTGSHEPVPSAHCATVGMLERQCGDEIRELTVVLEQQITSWLGQRLWAENKVRELVVHDERHSQRVDMLIAQLTLPLLVGGQLDPARILTLSRAAWLHDWGHEGGFVSGDLVGRTNPISVSSAEGVRDIHGLVARELLGDAWVGRHQVEPAEARLVGILAAHHQGWTSFGAAEHTRAQVRTTDGPMDITPPSLQSAVEGVRDDGNQDLELREVQLLVALLRVADSADIGSHRVPEERTSKIALLGRAVLAECRRYRSSAAQLTSEQTTAITVAEQLTQAHVQGQQYADLHFLKGQILAALDGSGLESLKAYVEFAQMQTDYYAWHRGVANVAFDIDETSNGIFSVAVEVVPANRLNVTGPHTDEALTPVQVVHRDVGKELGCRCNEPGMDHPKSESPGQAVAIRLKDEGLLFTTVRSVDGSDQMDFTWN